jgi:hypothetical protein
VDELVGDPHPHLARVRSVAPAIRVAALGGRLVTNRAVAIEVLRDADLFTVDDPRCSTVRVIGPRAVTTRFDGRDRGPVADLIRVVRGSWRQCRGSRRATSRRLPVRWRWPRSVWRSADGPGSPPAR